MTDKTKAKVVLAIVLIAATAAIAWLTLCLYQDATTTPAQNVVIASSSYRGGDETTYYNITIQFANNQTASYLVTCNLYPIGSMSFPLRYYHRVLIVPPSYGIDGELALPVGC